MIFDEFIDIAVIGFGFGGGMSAIAASEKNHKVVIFEKMSIPGGISICSGGGFRIARNASRAFEYLQETNRGTIPLEQLKQFSEDMVELPKLLKKLAKINNAEITTLDRPANYPLSGYETFQFMEFSSIPNFDPKKEYPKVKSLKAGINAFKVIEDNVKHLNIEVRYSNAVSRLITNDSGEVCGLIVDSNGKKRYIGTRLGVILACGGFEAGIEMQRQHWQLHPVLPAATLGNTGDGIKMAQTLGANIGHMWHFHGSYGFKHTDPRYPFGMRSKKLPDWTPGVTTTNVKMPWILINKDGFRFMNEYEPYGHDTGHRSLDRYEPTKNRFPNIPAFMIFDDIGRKMYPVASAYSNDPNVDPYEWSLDNLREVELGILKKADSLQELAAGINVSLTTLIDTLNLWNQSTEESKEDEFGRPIATYMSITQPPYFYGEVWPVVSNTQGALIHDTKQRVLNAFNESIPRLYVAGEIGSIWGFLYLSGGNLTECLISGQTAGREISALNQLVFQSTSEIGE